MSAWIVAHAEGLALGVALFVIACVLAGVVVWALADDET